MNPEIWGPPIWILFHTMIEKSKEESYPNLGREIFSFIFRISGYLPCPSCSQHATDFLRKIPINNIKTKDELKNMIYIFHNSVNKRKEKGMFNYEKMDQYKNVNLWNAYNQFINVYRTKGNLKLLSESFQRQIIVKNFKTWLMKNSNNFN